MAILYWLFLIIVCNILLVVAYWAFNHGKEKKYENSPSWIIWFAVAIICFLVFCYTASNCHAY